MDQQANPEILNSLIEYSVVVPLFNEEELFQELYGRLKAVMKSISESYEIIFIDDGSLDSTYNQIVEAAKNDTNVVAVSLSRNFGQENSIISGIQCSMGEVIFLMDGDLQDPPELIPQLLKRKNEGFDVVYAVKANRKESFVKKLLTSVFYMMMHFLGNVRMPVNAGIFSVMNRAVAMNIVNFPENNKYISGIRSYIGYNQSALPYNREVRKKGSSKSYYQLFRMGLNAFFSFSIFPLRLMMFVGILLNSLTALLFVALTVKVFFSESSHFDFNHLLLLYFLIQFIAIISFLIILSEYLGRTHELAKQRPDFIIKSVFKKGSLQSPNSIVRKG